MTNCVSIGFTTRICLKLIQTLSIALTVGGIDMFCAKLKEVMKMKAQWIQKWGLEQLKEDARIAEENRRVRTN